MVDALQCFDVLEDAMVSSPKVMPSRKVFMSGIDETSIAGDILADYADGHSGFPLRLSMDMDVPGWVDHDTTSIVMSISGDSGHALAVCREAASRGGQLVCITPEGAIAEQCQQLGGLWVPIGEAPDVPMAIMSVLGKTASIIQSTGACDAVDGIQRCLPQVRTWAESDMGDMSVIAEFIRGRIPAFYSTSDIHAASKMWRQAISSVTGRPAFYGDLPEFDHNELVGWSDPNAHSPDLRMVVLRGSGSSKLVDSIVGFMLEVLDENGRDVATVDLGDGDPVTLDLRAFAACVAVVNEMGGSID